MLYQFNIDVCSVGTSLMCCVTVLDTKGNPIDMLDTDVNMELIEKELKAIGLHTYVFSLSRAED